MEIFVASSLLTMVLRICIAAASVAAPSLRERDILTQSTDARQLQRTYLGTRAAEQLDERQRDSNKHEHHRYNAADGPS